MYMNKYIYIIYIYVCTCITKTTIVHWNKSKLIHWCMHKWMSGWMDEIMNVCLFPTVSFNAQYNYICHFLPFWQHKIFVIRADSNATDSTHGWTRSFPSLNCCTQDRAQSNLLFFWKKNFQEMVWSSVFPLWSDNNTTIIWLDFRHVQGCVDGALHLKYSLNFKTTKDLRTWQTWRAILCYQFASNINIKKQNRKTSYFSCIKIRFLSAGLHVNLSNSFRNHQVSEASMFASSILSNKERATSHWPLLNHVGPRGGEVGGAMMWILPLKKWYHNVYQDHLSPYW